MKVLISLLLILVSLSIVISIDKKTVNINLNAPLHVQYDFMRQKGEAFNTFLNAYKNSIGNEIIQNLYAMTDTIKQKQDPDWLNRISILSKLLGQDEKDVIAINLIYEIFCTSIILTSETDEIFMGRNLDYGFNNFIIDNAYEASYYKDGKLIIKAQGVVGYAGMLNGVRVGSYSVSMNQRYEFERSTNLEKAVMGYISPLYLLSRVLLESTTYEEALATFKSTNITAACYFVVAGTQKNQGAIITRSWENVDEEDYLDVDNGKWYLVETNSDRSYKDDGRRNYAEEDEKE